MSIRLICIYMTALIFPRILFLGGQSSQNAYWNTTSRTGIGRMRHDDEDDDGIVLHLVVCTLGKVWTKKLTMRDMNVFARCCFCCSLLLEHKSRKHTSRSRRGNLLCSCGVHTGDQVGKSFLRTWCDMSLHDNAARSSDSAIEEYCKVSTIMCRLTNRWFTTAMT